MNVASNKTVAQTIDSDYRHYAMYVLENRAIPCFIDGFKPVHRKLFYAMLNEHRGKKTKVSDLGGISKFNYHHGESSAMGAAVTLTAEWNNNVPLFQGHGNFGSRLIQEAAAPRYIFASANPEINKYFSDFEVCDKNSDEDSPEPQTYLPNIPWVLVNGVEGIAVGFACRYLPHSPVDIAKACQLAVKGKLKDDYVIPVTFPGFRGEVIQESATKVVTRGIVTRVKRNMWQITEAPWGYDRDQMFNQLDKMMADGKIVDFDDDCNDTGFNFSVKLDSACDVKCQKDPIAYFKLEKAFTENYTALDETGKLRLFQSKPEIIRTFVEYRVKKIGDKIQYDIKEVSSKLTWAMLKLNLIGDVLERKIDLLAMKKADLIAYTVDEYAASEENAAKLTQIPIVDMTTDKLADLRLEIAKLGAALEDLRQLVPTDVYTARLSAIK
jgi:DNA topoisomerase-2